MDFAQTVMHKKLTKIESLVKEDGGREIKEKRMNKSKLSGKEKQIYFGIYGIYSFSAGWNIGLLCLLMPIIITRLIKLPITRFLDGNPVFTTTFVIVTSVFLTGLSIFYIIKAERLKRELLAELEKRNKGEKK